MLRYRSVCSGIEAATVAWEPLGWEALSFSEIEPFPCSVLAHRFPRVPNLGDMTRFAEWSDDVATDVLVGGTPCQSFSVAGLRKGLADPRGNLALVYLAIADRFRPRWIVWENVPGVLSSNGGRDFGAFLGALGQLGYGWSYRVLDAQHFGVPQRRRRVFVVGHLGDWRRAAAVLFESESLCGNPAKGREARKDIAGTLASRTAGGGGLGTDFECSGGVVATLDASFGRLQCCSGQDAKHGHSHLVAYGGNNTAGPIQVATACNAKGTRFDFETETFLYQCHGSNVGPIGTLRKGNGNETGGVPFLPVSYRTAGDGAVYEEGDRVAPLTTNTDPSANIVAFQSSQSGVRTQEVHATLDSNNGSRRQNGVIQGHAVRRLTPRECERLQGFPDDWTLVPHRSKPAADGPRYKAIGNSMAVPVMRWIGERIQSIE